MPGPHQALYKPSRLVNNLILATPYEAGATVTDILPMSELKFREVK